MQFSAERSTSRTVFPMVFFLTLGSVVLYDSLVQLNKNWNPSSYAWLHRQTQSDPFRLRGFGAWEIAKKWGGTLRRCFGSCGKTVISPLLGSNYRERALLGGLRLGGSTLFVVDSSSFASPLVARFFVEELLLSACSLSTLRTFPSQLTRLGVGHRDFHTSQSLTLPSSSRTREDSLSFPRPR